MRRIVLVLLIAGALGMCSPVLAQNAPSPSAAPVAAARGRPWIRLAIFIPVSVLLGAGTVVVYRMGAARGWRSQ
jgi:hypothetical protein